MSEAITRDRYLHLIADESLPFAHRALWVLLWEGELRMGDLLSLDVRDVDLEARTAGVDFPKEGAPSTVPLSPNAALVLRMLIDGRTEGPLFVDAEGRPLALEAAARQASAAGVSIHGFRLGGHRQRLAETASS